MKLEYASTTLLSGMYKRTYTAAIDHARCCSSLRQEKLNHLLDNKWLDRNP
jgi:hypothetical protein